MGEKWIYMIMGVGGGMRVGGKSFLVQFKGFERKI